MANLNIKIPSTNQAFYDSVQAKANYNKVVNVIKPKYGKIISNIANLTNLPEELIYAFCFIESAGNPRANTPYAYGLLQLSPASASDALIREKGADRLRDGEADILKKHLGSRYSLIEKVKPKQTSIGKTFITPNDLYNEEFNLLIGSIFLKQLVDEYTENGVPRLDKVVVIYNRGRFDKVSKEVAKSKKNIDDLMASIPKGTADYVRKLLGVQGMMDVLV